MATITGVTAERANEIENKSVTGAKLVNGRLVLETFGGGDIDVGRIVAAPFESYPVGSVYMTDKAANPSTYMGGGTWVRWGKGRVPVSVDEVQSEFDVVEEVGGAKTHQLLESEMPTHKHAASTGTESAGHTHTGTTSSAGAHNHDISIRFLSNTSSGGSATRVTDVGNNTPGDGTLRTASTSSVGSHNHTMTTGQPSATHTHPVTVENTGLNQPHNNLQPYINVYMWKRTA